MAKKAQTNTINVLKWAIATVIFSMLMGCTVVNLSEKGRFVRLISPESTPPCEFLGVVEAEVGLAVTPVGTMRNVLNGMRNTVAEMGGNSYVLTYISANDGGGVASSQVDAYRCP